MIYSLIVALDCLANCLTFEGNFRDAYQYLREAKTIMDDELGEEHPETQAGDTAFDRILNLIKVSLSSLIANMSLCRCYSSISRHRSRNSDDQLSSKSKI